MWKTQNCTVNPDWSGPPLMVVNSVHVNLTTPSLRLVALAADNDPTTGNASLNTLPGIATQASAPPNLIAGINGGYFWRIDVDGFWVSCKHMYTGTNTFLADEFVPHSSEVHVHNLL